ncbi:uncharacterized protein LOC144067192 [Stigmatopora argus]
MMEVVLTRLRDFSCKTNTFDACSPTGVCRDPRGRPDCTRKGLASGEGTKLDIESALAWLRMELMEMRSQDQALIRQLMNLHSGIQELKQELSEGEEEDALDEEEGEETISWDSESEQGSVYSSSGEEASLVLVSLPKKPRCLYSTVLSGRGFSRRSSVP